MTSAEELARRTSLLLALNRNCTCEKDDGDVVTRKCPGHESLRDDLFVFHLYYGRSLAQQLMLEEWTVDSVPSLIREWAA